MDKDTASVVLSESFTNAGGTLKVDREAGIIRGVRILGLQSRNPPPRNLKYPLETQAQAVPLMEGAMANVGPHQKDISKLSYRDRIGVFRNVHTDDKGTVGDLHFNPKHDLAEQLAWDAEHAPEKLGFSILGNGDVNQRDRQNPFVEKITKVVSIDLVANPATNRGLFESMEDIPADQLEFCEHGFSAVSDLQEILRGTESQDVKTQRLQEVLSTWTGELAGNVSPNHKDKTMEWQDIKLEDLKKNRADLCEQLTGTDEASTAKAKAVQLQEQLDVATTALRSATDKLTAYEAERAKAVAQAAIAEELKAANVNASDTEVCTVALMEQLTGAKDAAARKPIIDLMAMAQKAKVPVSAPFADLSRRKEPKDTSTGERSWR